MAQTCLWKLAWIDELRQLISFEAIPGGKEYKAAEADFWPRILHLMQAGYRVQ